MWYDLAIVYREATNWMSSEEITQGYPASLMVRLDQIILPGAEVKAAPAVESKHDNEASSHKALRPRSKHL